MEDSEHTDASVINHDGVTAATAGPPDLIPDEEDEESFKELSESATVTGGIQAFHQSEKALTAEQVDEIVDELKASEPLRFRNLKPCFVQEIHQILVKNDWVARVQPKNVGALFSVLIRNPVVNSESAIEKKEEMINEFTTHHEHFLALMKPSVPAPILISRNPADFDGQIHDLRIHLETKKEQVSRMAGLSGHPVFGNQAAADSLNKVTDNLEEVICMIDMWQVRKDLRQ